MDDWINERAERLIEPVSFLMQVQRDAYKDLIVAALQDAIERCAIIAESRAEPYREEYRQSNHGHKCDCSTKNGALHYGRAQGMEMAAAAIRGTPND